MKYFKAIIIILSSVLLYSCQDDFLKVKPNKALVVPDRAEDFQAILDYTQIMNRNTQYLPELSSADFYVGDGQLFSEGIITANTYLWKDDIYEGRNDILDWNQQYRVIYYSNVVLDGVQKLERIHISPDLNKLKGDAMFYRAWAFYQLAQQFCKPYDVKSSRSDLGLPLKLDSDINRKSVRSTVEETYAQIINDLKYSAENSSKSQSIKTRPSRSAAFALLSKTYLQMNDYESALKYADSCLQLNNSLMDYNDLSVSAQYPIPLYNKEVIFQSNMQYSWLFNNSNLRVDSILYNSYEANDLRKNLFYINNNGTITYKGSYDQSLLFFSGIATDEIYLISAECNARLGQMSNALDDLNFLLARRYKKESFKNLEIEDTKSIVERILQERRKELVFRGIRWADLRRLNQNGEFSISLVRTVNNVKYELKPNSSKYVFAIPDIVINMNNIAQNIRED